MPTEDLYYKQLNPTTATGSPLGGGLTKNEKLLIAGAAGVGGIGLGIVGTGGTQSKMKAKAGGALTTGLSGAMSGAVIGTGIAPGIGTAIGAGIGLLGGGIVGAFKGSKDYTDRLKAERAGQRKTRFAKYETAARGRSSASKIVDATRKQYAASSPPAELDVQTTPGVASYDMYKGRTYGG